MNSRVSAIHFVQDCRINTDTLTTSVLWPTSNAAHRCLLEALANSKNMQNITQLTNQK